MKKNYLFFLMSLCTFTYAQTLTQSFNEPVAGDIDKGYRLDTSAYTTGLPVHVTGNNLSWDFTKLEGAFPMVVDSFIAPGSVPTASDYPTATFVQHRDPLYTFFKSTGSPQQTELLGAYSPSLSLNFTNSAIIASYPVSYGYNLSDQVVGTFNLNGTTGACVGNITISADGFGTANFPNNVAIQNVLCLKSVQVLTLSINFFPFGTYSQTYYYYYMPGKKFPILKLDYKTYQLAVGTPTVTGYAYGSDNYFSVAGIPQLGNDDSYKVFPNPFTGQLFISEMRAAEENEYVFYNTAGQLLLNTPTLNTKEIDRLAHGLYFLEIRNKNGTYRQRVIKE